MQTRRKRVAGMATLPQREECLKDALVSIYDQMDEIYLILNLYERVPEWIARLRKVSAVLGDNSLGVEGKFFFAGLNPGCYFFGIDDDLVYPAGYANYMIAGEQKHKAIVTLHGKRFDNAPITSYRRDFTLNVRCLGSLGRDTRVHTGGTGVMLFDTNRFNVNPQDFKHKNMGDVQIAKLANERSVPIIALAHRHGYMKYLFPPGDTVWHTQKDDRIQTEIVNSIIRNSRNANCE